MLFDHHHVFADREDVGIHPVHLFLGELKHVLGSEQVDKVAGVPRIEEAVLVDDSFVAAHRHESAVEVQDALIGVGVTLSEIERNDVLLGEKHRKVVEGQAVGARCLHLRVILEGILPHEHAVVPQNHVAAFDMDGLGQVVDLLVVNLAVDRAISIDLFLPVGDYVGDYYLVVDYETHIAGENLVASFYRIRSVDYNSIFSEHRFESVHLADDVFVARVDALRGRLIGLGVEGLFRSRSRTVGFRAPKYHFAQASRF